MKTVLVWDLRSPRSQPQRLALPDALASAIVRSGAGAAADPAEAGALSAGGALSSAELVEVVLPNGNSGQMVRAALPLSVVTIGAGLGLLASIGAPVAGGGIPTPPPSLYLGAVATRGFVPNALSAANVEVMSQTRHVARDDITTLQPLYGAWHLNDPATETPLTGPTQIRLSVSLSTAGPWTTFTYGGQLNGSIPAGGNLLPDPLAFAVPKGTPFFLRVFQHNDNGIALSGATVRNNAGGDIASYGATVTDRLTGGTIVSSGSSVLYPLAILGMTRLPSVLLVGDSRTYSEQDTHDASGDIAEVARSIGAAFGYINTARRTMSANQFVTGDHSRRVALGQYCSHVLTNIGVNDFLNEARTSAATIVAIQTIWGYFPDKTLMATTITPYTTGAWTSADGSDQVIGAGGVKVDEVNTFIRGKPAPLAAMFDIADVVSLGRGANFKWKAPGETSDGVHALQQGALRIFNSGVINTSLIVRS